MDVSIVALFTGLLDPLDVLDDVLCRDVGFNDSQGGVLPNALLCGGWQVVDNVMQREFRLSFKTLYISFNIVAIWMNGQQEDIRDSYFMRKQGQCV